METRMHVLSEDGDQLWMRVRYNMPPSDPRLLSLTSLDILIEREKVEFFTNEGKLLQFCTDCGIQTYRNACPLCGSDEHMELGPTGDSILDEIIEKDPEGTEINLDDYFPVIPRGEKAKLQ